MQTTRLTDLEKRCLEDFKRQVSSSLGDLVVEHRLFGSRARGEGDEDSDLDVLVLTRRIDVPIKNAVWDIANDILLQHDVNISPLVMTADNYRLLVSRERLLALDIEREGVLL